MLVILIVLAYMVFGAYEYIPLYKQKQWKDFWVNAVLGILSFSIAVLLGLGVKIPSPAVPIQTFITSIFGK